MSAFDTAFAANAMPGLLTQFGTDVERWPGGDWTAKADEVWMIELDKEQGGSTSPHDQMTIERNGRSTNLYLTLIGSNEYPVSVSDKFKFTHPSTGAVVANAVRRVRAGAMQAWVCVVPNGLDTKHARVRG